MQLAARAAPVLLAAAAAFGYAAAAIFRHERFGSNAYDLGLFDQTIWGYSRFELLPNTVVRLPNLLGDHFHPILIALGPLYWLWDDPRVLLVAQAILLSLASLPIYFWARRELGNGAALLFQVAYLVFWAVLGGDVFDFHDLAVAAPIVSLALYATLARADRLLVAAVVLALLTREDLALVLIGLGAYIWFVQGRRRFGAVIAGVAAIWLVAMIELVIPAFADRAYAHASSIEWRDPGSALKTLFTPREKLVALFNLLAPWLALPLVSPLFYLVAGPTLLARFASDKPSHWAAQGFHYSLVLAPVLAFAAIDTTVRIRRWSGGRARPLLPLAAGAGVVLAGLYFSFHRLSPLDELKRYTSDEKIAAIEECLATIPPDASVAATSALVPHLSHRRRIYQLDLRPVPDVDVYALDTSTWFYPLTREDVRAIVAAKRQSGYRVRCAREDVVVLARRA